MTPLRRPEFLSPKELVEELIEWAKVALTERERALLSEVAKRLQHIADQEDAIWALRADAKRCRCGAWVNSPKCQAFHAGRR